jgi:hypothetical protein
MCKDDQDDFGQDFAQSQHCPITPDPATNPKAHAMEQSAWLLAMPHVGLLMFSEGLGSIGVPPVALGASLIIIYVILRHHR